MILLNVSRNINKVKYYHFLLALYLFSVKNVFTKLKFDQYNSYKN